MAFTGSFQEVRTNAGKDPRFVAAFAYVADMLAAGSTARARIGGIAVGVTERIELTGGSFALEQVYQPKQRPEGFFESHRNYIDVQVIVEGEELMELIDVGRLAVSQPYNPERDFTKYADVAGAKVLQMRAGDVAIFFPNDGHMPSLHWRGTGLVRKTVVKVPVG
jgi:YhcH/YjgK/YiaL family protein